MQSLGVLLHVLGDFGDVALVRHFEVLNRLGMLVFHDLDSLFMLLFHRLELLLAVFLRFLGSLKRSLQRLHFLL